MKREPAASGYFYPSKNEEIEAMLEPFRDSKTKKINAYGMILPHAGYAYSGGIAAETVNTVIPKRKLIILGPNHSGTGAPFAVWPAGSWNTPCGEIPVEEKIASRIMGKCPKLEESYKAHRGEHSIEVLLPILKYFFGEFSFVPISCVMSSLQDYRFVGEKIAQALKNESQEIMIVASTDFTHYEPEPTVRRKDRMALKEITEMNEAGLLAVSRENNISMCGLAPVAIALACLKKLGASKARVIKYQTSAQVNRDSRSAVGYAGVVIS